MPEHSSPDVQTPVKDRPIGRHRRSAIPSRTCVPRRTVSPIVGRWVTSLATAAVLSVVVTAGTAALAPSVAHAATLADVTTLATLREAVGRQAAVMAVNDLPTIVSNLRTWVMGILAALATLFLTIGGVRYLMAGGDPSEVERAKAAFRSAGVGYVLAAISPVVLTVLQSIIGS